MGAERLAEGRIKRALRHSPARKALMWHRHRDLRPEDVFVASYPRSGNTWLRFMLVELVTKQRSTFISIEEVAPAVGYHSQGPALTRGGGRLIKTHEPYRREYRRAIYLVRDIRAVAMSQYRVLNLTKYRDMTLDEFVDEFTRGRLDGYGTWQAHIKSWTTDRDPDADVLLIRYEDMRANPVEHVLAAAEFVGIECTPEDVATVLENNSKDNIHGQEQEVVEWGAKVLGWKTRDLHAPPTPDWRTALSEGQLAKLLAPTRDVLARFGYQA